MRQHPIRPLEPKPSPTHRAPRESHQTPPSAVGEGWLSSERHIRYVVALVALGFQFLAVTELGEARAARTKNHRLYPAALRAVGENQ
jgi:hypothetical protein